MYGGAVAGAVLQARIASTLCCIIVDHMTVPLNGMLGARYVRRHAKILATTCGPRMGAAWPGAWVAVCKHMRHACRQGSAVSLVWVRCMPDEALSMHSDASDARAA